MNLFGPTPTKDELVARVSQLSTREELGAYEAIVLIRTVIVPLLAEAKHDCSRLFWHACQSAVVSAQAELSRLIRLEERSLESARTDPAADDPNRADWLAIRTTGVQLMHLVAEMRIHMDIAIV